MSTRAVLALAIVLTFVVHRPASGEVKPEHSGKAENVFNHTSVEEAWKAAVARQRPLLVMFTSENCTYCKKMIADTYGNPEVQQVLRDRTESVMAHAEDYEPLIKRLGIRGYPSSLLISPDGEVLDFIEGYVEPKTFTYRIVPLLKGPIARVGRVEPVSSTN